MFFLSEGLILSLGCMSMDLMVFLTLEADLSVCVLEQLFEGFTQTWKIRCRNEAEDTGRALTQFHSFIDKSMTHNSTRAQRARNFNSN